jgi:hypothetical protein
LVVALNDDVADVDADPELHVLTGRSIGILLGDSILHRDSTLHGVDGAGEISDEAIACRVEDPTAMRSDQPIDDCPISREDAKRAHLVPAHEGAVASNIGGEDRGELPFDGWRFQPRHLPNPEYIPTSCEIRGLLSHSEARWCVISGSNEVFTVSTRSPRTGSARGFHVPPLQALLAKRCCSQSRRAGFVERKSAMSPLFVGRVKPVNGSEGK